MKIGFVGLGQMGWPMCGNLTAKLVNDTIIGYDSAGRSAFEEKPGAGQLQIADSIRELEDCEIIITMLPHGKAVRSVLLGEGQKHGGLADKLKRGTIVIDMSSSSPADTASLNYVLQNRGIHLADAPVSGSVPKARAATLSIILGCDDAVALRITPILQAMGTEIVRTGAVGTAHAMKSLNNYVYAAGLFAACEAVLMGEALGLDLATLVDVMNASSGRNVATETKIKQHMLQDGDFRAGFSLALMAKDLGITHSLKDVTGFTPPQLELCHRVWQDAAAQLAPDADNTAILHHLRARLLPESKKEVA